MELCLKYQNAPCWVWLFFVEIYFSLLLLEVQPFIELYPQHVTFPIKVLSSLNVSLTLQVISLSASGRTWSSHSCHSDSGGIVVVVADTQCTFRSFLTLSWSLEHWGWDLESPNRLAMKISKTAAHFGLLLNLHSRFHVYKLVEVVMFACLCTHLKIIAVIQTPDIFLGDDGFVIF